MVSANVPTLQGGASNAATLARGERLGRIAWENRLPHIQLVQSVSSALKSVRGQGVRKTTLVD